MATWEIIYRKAINDDGTLFFPEKLSHEFLESQKRTQGSYIFANQYQNEIIPLELQTFKKHWIKYYESIPKNVYNFAFVDPAISQADTADFTGIVIVSVDEERRWYVRFARRFKITPTQIITLLFEIHKNFNLQGIGIEDVAYQKALLYFLSEEMRRRGQVLPIKGVTPPTDKTKQMRILSLVPRFEWGHIFLNQGLTDLELELAQFPRGAHDDLIDALAGIEQIYFTPSKEPEWKNPPGPAHPSYEKWYIQNLRRSNNEANDESPE